MRDIQNAKADRAAYLHRLRRAVVFWALAALFVLALQKSARILQAIPPLIVLGSIAILWTASCFAALGFIYLGNLSDAFGKLRNGELSRTTRFWPYLVLTNLVWHLWRMLSREPATSEICAGLTVGRRLVAKERPSEVEIVVDLTAEFAEPDSVRTGVEYYSFPILDGSAPDPSELLAFARWLDSSKHAYIHCAQGHGRTGLVTLAVLLERKVVSNIPEGLALLKARRPGIGLSAGQLHCIETMQELMRQE